jgi:hypothetical protein
MYLLVSVHRVEDVPLRLYPSHELAMACQGEWIPAQTDSEFQGFRLIEFGIDGRMTGRSEFFEGEEMAYVPCLEASSACLPRREPVPRHRAADHTRWNNSSAVSGREKVPSKM